MRGFLVRPARRSTGVGLATALVMMVATGSCSTTAGRGVDPPDGHLTVLAASSLTGPFSQIAEVFEAEHPGATVALSFGPSDGLAQQILAGSPADVFASASPAWMDAVAADGPVEERTDFARNRLTIVVPMDNPARIRSVQDLARPGVKLVVAAEGVPVGDYARQVFEDAGIAAPAEANVVSNEEDAKAVLQKVVLGEADAGVVYVTDATDLAPAAAQQIVPVEIPDDVNVVAAYPIAVLGDSSDPRLARDFEALVVGGEGQSVLRRHGFLPAA